MKNRRPFNADELGYLRICDTLEIRRLRRRIEQLERVNERLEADREDFPVSVKLARLAYGC